jgi:ornithine cyclodeaminase/alanine dehydrogenase-like protein (mu-crystallin family)
VSATVVLDATAVRRRLPVATAVAALRQALLDGLDPAADPARAVVPVRGGQLLLMPAQWGRYAGVKVATVAPANPTLGLPRIQGSYLLLDGATLTPLALLDGVALTAIRTAAVSAVAADLLAEPDAADLVVFGTGPQALGHVSALRTVRDLRRVVVVGRDPARTAAFVRECAADCADSGVEVRTGTSADVASADLVACCTTAREPLFDGTLLRPTATVIAVGSHEPDAAEVDAVTVCGATVVVEARHTALREAGDVVRPVRAGLFDPSALSDIADLVLGKVDVAPGRPRLFKSVGMAWEDLVVAVTTYETSGEDHEDRG